MTKLTCRTAPLAAATVLAATVIVGVASGAASAGEGVPYTDPAQHGYIGFCDASGQSIDHGSVSDIPFVATAVSSVAATSPWDGDGRAATLYAYQPREGVTPAEWSGEAVTPPALYSNPAHPMAKGTKGDISMGQFVSDYPANWDGFVELRMVLTANDAPAATTQYPATDIQVEHGTWHVVRGGDVPCDSGHAKSIASVLAPRAAAGRLIQHSSSPGAAGAHRGSPPSSSGSRSGGEPSAATESRGTSSASSDSSGSSAWPWLIAAVALVAAVAGGLAFWRRRST